MRKSPHLRAFAVTAGRKGYGSIPLRPDSAASFPEKKIVSYLSKNPVNLSVFIEFFRNSLSSSEAIGSAMIPVFSSSPVPANAGKCGGRPRPGRALAPLAGGVEKPPERVMATPLKGKLHKGNPPYPPLTGGYKKAMRSRRAEGVLLFLAPLSRGGRGGCSFDKGFCNNPRKRRFADMRPAAPDRRSAPAPSAGFPAVAPSPNPTDAEHAFVGTGRDLSQS